MELTKTEQLKLTLQLMECHFGMHHLEVAESVSELAHLYFEHKDYAKAEPLYWRALEIRQRHLGSDHKIVAGSLRDLAKLFEALNQPEDAERFLQWACAIEEKVANDSEAKLPRALDIETLVDQPVTLQDKLSLDHLTVATGLIEVARQSEEEGLTAQSVSIYKRALVIQARVLGMDHTVVANGFGVLASLLRKMGDISQATEMEARSAAIFKRLHAEES